MAAWDYPLSIRDLPFLEKNDYLQLHNTVMNITNAAINNKLYAETFDPSYQEVAECVVDFARDMALDRWKGRDFLNVKELSDMFKALMSKWDEIHHEAYMEDLCSALTDQVPTFMDIPDG